MSLNRAWVAVVSIPVIVNIALVAPLTIAPEPETLGPFARFVPSNCQLKLLGVPLFRALTLKFKMPVEQFVLATGPEPMPGPPVTQPQLVPIRKDVM